MAYGWGLLATTVGIGGLHFNRKNLFPTDSEHCVKEDIGSFNFQKWFFKLRIEPGEDATSFTTAFNKTVYMHDDYPNKVLVIYEGDYSAVNPKYSHGNSKLLEKKRKTVLSHF